MKKLKLAVTIICFITLAKGQNLPACDSLVINCCTFISGSPAAVILQVSNYSSVLFDYPAFALFDSNMDTIAKETVTYFGISPGPQPHTMIIMAPLVLPFSGFLNLYTWFYDSLACSFPFTIPDTITGIPQTADIRKIKIFPNPAADHITILLRGISADDNFSLEIADVLGNKIFHSFYAYSPAELLLDGLKPGIYFLSITGTKKQWQSIQKFIIQEKEKF